MPTTTDHSSATTADREIVSVRVFDYPPQRVFEAFRNPNELMCWWGPKGFTNSFEEFDLRPGGLWRFVMHGPDGKDYRNESVFVEVAPAERIVFDHLNAPKFRMTLTFEDFAGKTRLHWRMLFETAAVCAAVQRYAPEANEQNFDRLAAQLAKGSHPAADAAGGPFIISRAFNAPRDLVWKAYTERERLMNWFGPKGFAMLAATLDLRPSGVFHYCMRGSNGAEMWGKWIFREIVKPEKLVYTVSFSDAAGGVTRHPLSANWPLETLSTATLTEHEGKTTIALQWTTLNATAEEQKTFDASHDGMRMGFTATFDQLEEYLAKVSQSPDLHPT
jgi:uncharacterized protein YndB with AHSA1/START domain